jgi:ribose transport system permease protein
MGISFLKRNLKVFISYGLFITALIGVCIFVEGFGKFDHLLYILMIAAFLGIVSAGQTMVIMIGAIDLSVGSVITLSGVLMTQSISKWSFSLPIAILLVLVTGIAIGMFNGFGVSILKIPPLVMTLASTGIVQGLSLIATNGTPGAINIEYFTNWATQPVILGLNGIILTWIVVTVIISFILMKTSFGRSVYCTGLGEKAAILAGFKTRQVTSIVYIISGITSGITGVLLVGFTGQSYLTMGNQYQLLSIAAVVVGGASILGGSGSYFGTVAGVLVLTLITSVLTLFRIPAGGQMAIQGAIILLMVILNSIERIKDNRG